MTTPKPASAPPADDWQAMSDAIAYAPEDIRDAARLAFYRQHPTTAASAQVREAEQLQSMTFKDRQVLAHPDVARDVEAALLGYVLDEMAEAEAKPSPEPVQPAAEPWLCGFCRQEYTLDALCCQDQLDTRKPAAEPAKGATEATGFALEDWKLVGDVPAEQWAAAEPAPATINSSEIDSKLIVEPVPVAQGDAMLPDSLGPVAREWYVLCERAPHATKIGISGELAEAIVATIADHARREAELQTQLRHSSIVGQQSFDRAQALEASLAACRADADVGAAIERAAKELPHGWDVVIKVECGAGSVELVTPGGNTIDFSEGDAFADYINAATDAAIDALRQEAPHAE